MAALYSRLVPEAALSPSLSPSPSLSSDVMSLRLMSLHLAILPSRYHGGGQWRRRFKLVVGVVRTPHEITRDHTRCTGRLSSP